MDGLLSAFCGAPFPEEEVRVNVQWLGAASTVPPALWAEAKVLGLLADFVPVPPPMPPPVLA
jgi:hypothetical protein